MSTLNWYSEICNVMYEIVVELSWKIHINYVLKNFYLLKVNIKNFNKKVYNHSKKQIAPS